MNKSLYFDDDGKALNVGDFVLINDEIITMIKTAWQGGRNLGGIGGTLVESVLIVSRRQFHGTIRRNDVNTIGVMEPNIWDRNLNWDYRGREYRMTFVWEKPLTFTVTRVVI